MKVPNAHAALVEREKLTEYLLNPAHPDNGGKAPFFLSLGFSREDWPVLATALRILAENKRMESPYGQKYILDGRIESPSGRTPVVRSIWIVDRVSDTPRLVTAYPHED